MDRNQFIRISCILGALAVALGAFGAHTLKNLVNEAALHSYHTGVQYHFYHTLTLLFAGLFLRQHNSKWIIRAGWLFVAGIFLFSGSLYTITFCKAAGVEQMNWLGAVTPLGGLCFIAGWLCLLPASKSL